MSKLVPSLLAAPFDTMRFISRVFWAWNSNGQRGAGGSDEGRPGRSLTQFADRARKEKKMETLTFTCRCGQVSATLTVKPGSGTHTRCHCILCHKAMQHFGLEADRAEGVDIYQTTPDRLSVDLNSGSFRSVKVSPNDMIRWVTTCCDTPMFTTAGRRIYSHVGVALCNIENPSDLRSLGPVRAHSYIETRPGKWRHQNPLGLMAGFIRRGAWNALTGRYRQTPFFDPQTGQPVIAPELLPRLPG